MRKKLRVDRRWADKHCRDCIWCTREGLCPFLSCPKVFGWITDKKRSQKATGGKNGVSN